MFSSELKKRWRDGSTRVAGGVMDLPDMKEIEEEGSKQGAAQTH